MFRLSRINAPRGTVAAFGLLVVALLLFGIIAQAHGPAIVSPVDAAGLEAAMPVTSRSGYGLRNG